MSNRVLVLYSNKQPAMPCHSARARELLSKGKAAVYRRQPFTIILKERESGDSQDIELRIDPGSKTTGLAVVAEFKRGSQVVYAANLEHRGHLIKMNLDSRRSLRRTRRGRKTRYRQPRFLNRAKPKGWLPPSLMSRVFNVETWANKFCKTVPIQSFAVETVRFDMQKMQNPEISGVEYQQGELQGYEVREYLLEKWNRTCAYCGVKNVPLQVEHIHPKAKGGTNRISNLSIACEPCNKSKGTQALKDWKPSVADKVLRQSKLPLRDAAAVNATRYAIGNMLKSFGLETTFWSGGRTKKNRISQGYAKDHWIDAAVVGEAGANVRIPVGMQAQTIKAKGRGKHQVVRTDKFGFPRGKAGRVKRVHGFQTGDLVKLDQPRGKYAGTHVGPLAGIRANGTFDIQAFAKISANFKNFTLIERGNGYVFA